MAVDRIKHTKPASERTFLDELEPIPYEITEEELASMDPKMKKILFGIEEPPERPEIVEAEETGETVEEPAAAAEVQAREQPETQEAAREETEQEFDPRIVADFPPTDRFTITLVFPVGAGEEKADELARGAPEYKEVVIGGRRWHAARFYREQATRLKALDENLDVKREDVYVLVNGKRAPFGRALWLKMMYIFTAGVQD